MSLMCQSICVAIILPMVAAMTTPSPSQVAWALRQLKISGAGTGFIHESYSADDPPQFTRPWFAWANAMFGEWVLHAARHYPGILAEKL